MQEDKIHVGYYAIIPADVRYSSKLSPNAKLLYGEITALCNREGFCWSSNKYFADLYKVDSGTISRWVSQLIKAEFIRVEILDSFKRKIYLSKERGGRQKRLGGYAKTPRGVRQKAQYNITVNNTTKEHAVAIAPAFSFKEEIKKMEENPRRDLNLIALYASERFKSLAPKIMNPQQLSSFIKRHLRDAKAIEVGGYTDNQITTATEAVKAKYRDIDWTLGTILKELTK